MSYRKYARRSTYKRPNRLATSFYFGLGLSAVGIITMIVESVNNSVHDINQPPWIGGAIAVIGLASTFRSAKR